MDMRKRPTDSFDRKAPGDLCVLKHVGVVIQIDEWETNRLTEDQPGDRSDENANGETNPAIARENGVVSHGAGLGSAAHWSQGAERIKRRSGIAR